MKARKLKDNPFLTFAPPGHFYSPLPSMEDIKKHAARIWGKNPSRLPGIDLNTEEQLSLAVQFQAFHQDLPFGDQEQEQLRYYYGNNFYPKGDGQTLYHMIRHLTPKNIIEIGSGFSSAVILDTNELFFDNAISCKFVEPYPDRLMSLLKKDDLTRIEVASGKLQDIELETFSVLLENDILFVDSTHVSKLDSDVNYILFSILPHLESGVYIHFHDIFYPFEYPKKWLLEGRAWNEAYLLRAFLQYNKAFKIVWFMHYLMNRHHDHLLHALPGYGGGGSLWLKKL
jgi:predicted O-methyltransferase YrrM